MNVIFIILVCIVSIGIFILHSYFKYGAKATFNFFFFAFFISALKEGPVRINGEWAKNPAMPYEFLKAGPSELINTFLAVFGWVFTFYLGWYIACRISQRIYPGKKRIFSFLLLAGIVTASIGYAVEAAAIGAGLWHWTLDSITIPPFLVGVPFIALVTWAHFPTQYLFLPFFLINFSKFKEASWKGVFFAIPFIHSLAADFKPVYVRQNLEYIAVVVLIVLAFVSSLEFKRKNIKLLPVSRWLERLPMLVIIFLFLILIYLDLVKAKNAELLISLLPLFILVLSSIRKIPLWLTGCFSFIFLIFFRSLALPVLIIFITILSLKGLRQK